MKLRVARHTANLKAITAFYTGLLGLEILGSFEDHDQYDGVFLGLPGMSWHLEFTTSNESPLHQPDDDDLLVFYPGTAEQYTQITDRFNQAGLQPVKAKTHIGNYMVLVI